MISTFTRFFDYTQSDKQQNINLLFQITQGFLPRRFLDNIYDHIIYDEDQEVDEMYFIQEGFIGIGYTNMYSGIANQPYKMAKTQRN